MAQFRRRAVVRIQDKETLVDSDSDSIGFCGEACAPHFGQYVEVAVWSFGHETLHTTDVFKGTTPLDVKLYDGCLHLM